MHDGHHERQQGCRLSKTNVRDLRYSISAAPPLLGANDILSNLGFLRHIMACMQLKRHGLVTMGVKCSSWVVINRDSPDTYMWCAF